MIIKFRKNRCSNNLFIFFLIAGLLVCNKIVAQSSDSQLQERAIEFPDIPGYKTLVGDFHQHTVFSDGKVWPSIRVEEALKDKLDVISITDHLEYQPFKNDIPHTDRNRSYKLAQKEAKDKDIIVINGAEITRGMPPGHLNAIFLNDANKLRQDDVLMALREAKKQDAFIFWNHPNSIAQRPDGIAKLSDMHIQLIEEGLIHGIEVVNDNIFSDEAIQIAIDYNLTFMGNSDVHGLIDWDYNIPGGGHRPVTLVFAKEKSAGAIKEGLKNRRTVVWFKNTLIGNSEYLVPLIQESLVVKKTEVLESHKGKSLVQSVFIENLSDVDYIFENQSDFSFNSHSDIITIKAHEITNIHVKTLEIRPAFDLRFKALNAYVAPNIHPEIVFNIKLNEN